MTRIDTTEKTLLSLGGTETYLQFIQEFALREFCAFEIFGDEEALAELERAFIEPTANAVAEAGHALLIDALVWRAHPDYLDRLGYDASELASLNARAVGQVRATVAGWRERSGFGESDCPVFVGGDVGPRGDGYQVADAAVTAADALAYHRAQLRALAEAGVDVITAMTMTSVGESVGICQAAAEVELPVILSPTVETDGTTPDGRPLGEFIERVDEATDGGPLYYMVNCAHPEHLEPTLRRAREQGAGWLERFKGLRANASRKSHEELDNSSELDRGDPRELAQQIADLQRAYDLQLVGGCCGTDAEHIAVLARALN